MNYWSFNVMKLSILLKFINCAIPKMFSLICLSLELLLPILNLRITPTSGSDPLPFPEIEVHPNQKKRIFIKFQSRSHPPSIPTGETPSDFTTLHGKQSFEFLKRKKTSS